MNKLRISSLVLRILSNFGEKSPDGLQLFISILLEQKLTKKTNWQRGLCISYDGSSS